MRRFVLTGAPGAGKTTLLGVLRRDGYEVVAEAATDVIAQEQARGVDAPWLDPKFIDDIVSLQRRRQRAATGRIQLFDRSPVCALALCRWLGFPVSPALTSELARIEREGTYQRNVIFVEDLGHIEPTAARRISLEDARRFGLLHRRVYRELGYQLTSIPAAPVEARAAAVAAVVGPPDHENHEFSVLRN